MGGSPLGGAHGQGVRTASPFRPEGRMGLTGRAPGWGGGRQAASKQRASKKANGWEPPGGRMGRGAHGKPQSPEGRRGLPSAPLGGAGENCSRQGYCAPDVRGRRGLASSICVISACANIHRISPQCCPAVGQGAKGYLLIVVQARQVPQRQQRAKGYL